MKKAIGILILVCFALLSNACQGSALTQPPTLSEKDQFRMLREDAFKITPGTLGLKVDPNSNTPYGIIVDEGLAPETTLTIAAYASGDAYFLTNSGKSNVDGIKIETVNSAAQKFVSTAADFIERMKPLLDDSLPSVNHVKFYILTLTGTYASEELLKKDLIAKSNSFSPLYEAEQAVVTAFQFLPNP